MPEALWTSGSVRVDAWLWAARCVKTRTEIDGETVKASFRVTAAPKGTTTGWWLGPFSCKGRGFCPSCGGRRMATLALRLVDDLLPWVAVRQLVLLDANRIERMHAALRSRWRERPTRSATESGSRRLLSVVQEHRPPRRASARQRVR